MIKQIIRLKDLSLVKLLIMLICPIVCEAENLHVIGSSTLYPFMTIASERFSKLESHNSPIIEATGTGSGIKLFCTKVADVAMASRAITPDEIKLCQKNDVKIGTFIIGLDGIILANDILQHKYNFSPEILFLALAKEVPINGALVNNPNHNWAELKSSLPNIPINIYGPSVNSGTRTAFLELAYQDFCMQTKEYIMAYPDLKIRRNKCHNIRSDGAYIEMGENDNLLINKLIANKNAVGIFGFNFLEQHEKAVKAASFNHNYPSINNIKSKRYPLARPLYIYYNLKSNKFLLHKFINYIKSDHVSGQDGYLMRKGLISD